MKNTAIAHITICAFFLANCSPSPDKTAAAELSQGHEAKGHENKVFFNPGKGLGLSPDALASLGVVTEEVGTGKLASRRSVSAQIFRQADEKSVNGRYRQGSAYASALLPSTELSSLQPGSTVQVSTSTGSIVEGKISRIDNQLQELNSQSELIVEIHPADSSLTVGSALTLQFLESGEKAEETTVVPDSAVLKTAKGSFAYVENAGFYLKTPVQTGNNRDGKIQILDGLFEGDVVVVRGTQGLYLTELQAVNAGAGCADGH